MTGDEIYKGLLDRGYAPVQAAALAGNIAQESGFNPSALNQGEGANGLLQWRLDRWRGLQDFAKARGTSPNDANTQLDFIGAELAGPEKRNSTAFFGAPDLASANAALKRYIRYGDQSEGTRLANAQGFLKGQGAAPMSMAGPAASSAPEQAATPPAGKSPALQIGGSGAAPAVDLAALAATPQLTNFLQPRPNLFGLKTAPFSFRGA
jgi:hypothetical protein